MRRGGRKNDWLFTDELTGFTQFGSKIKTGYYGERAVKPYKRNLQEIATPLTDPAPVPMYSGPSYEITSPCSAEVAPLYVGNTTVRTNPNNPAFQILNLDPGIGSATVGCTLVVH